MNILKKMLRLSLVLLCTSLLSMDPKVKKLEDEQIGDPSIRDPQVNWATLPAEISVILAKKLQCHELITLLTNDIVQKIEPDRLDYITDRVYSIAMSTNGRRVVVGCAWGGARIWIKEKSGWHCEAQLSVDHDQVPFVRFSDDGCRVIIESTYGGIQVWALTDDGWCIESRPNGHYPLAVEFSTCRQLLVGSCNEAYLLVKKGENWQRTGSFDLKGRPPEVQAIFTQDAGVLIRDKKEVQTWTKASGAWCCNDVFEHNNFDLVAFSAHGPKMLTASRSGEVIIWVKDDMGWRCEYKEQLYDVSLEETLTKGIRSIALSRNSQRVAIGGSDGMLVTWVCEDDDWHKEAVLQGPASAIELITFSSCGGFLITDVLSVGVMLWNIRPLLELSEIKKNLLFHQTLLLTCIEKMRNDNEVLDFADPTCAQWKYIYQGLPEKVRRSLDAWVKNA